MSSKLIVPQRKLIIGGVFSGRIVRPHLQPDESVWHEIEDFEDHNTIVGEGIDDMLAVYLTGAAQSSNWYLSVFSNNYQPNANDKAATIAANAGEFTNYQPATRPAYSGVENAQQCGNSASPATFTFGAAATIYGAFLISSSNKQSTSGKLLAAALFSSPKQVAANDQLILTYTVQLQAA